MSLIFSSIKKYYLFFLWVIIELLWGWIVFTPIYDNTDALFNLTSDAISYIETADNLYKAEKENKPLYTIKSRGLYPYLFYLFYKIFNNTHYYYIQLGYLILVFLLKFFIFCLFKNILREKEFIIFLLLFSFNYFVFGSYTLLLWPNSFFMGITFFLIYLFYKFLITENKIFLWFTLMGAILSTTFRVEGIITVATLCFYTLFIYKNVRKPQFIIILTLISIPIIAIDTFYLYTSYHREHIFSSFNPLATVYAIYRYIFRINYEIFFLDFKKGDSGFFTFISYLISLLISLVILIGIKKIYLEKKINLLFVILYIFFLCLFFIHTPPPHYKKPEDFILLGYYDARFFIFVFPVLCLAIIKIAFSNSIHILEIWLKKFTMVFIVLYLCVNIGTGLKNKITHYKNWSKRIPILSYGINNLKVGCLIEEKSVDGKTTLEKFKIIKRDIIAYILFRNKCEYIYYFPHTPNYDYVIDFTNTNNSPSPTAYIEIFSCNYAWQNSFKIYKKRE